MIKEKNEKILEEPLADDYEGNSRRGMLKQMGLTATALAATTFMSSKASSQEQSKQLNEPITESGILAALRKQGITNLQQLAHNAAASQKNSTWVFISATKYIYKDVR